MSDKPGLLAFLRNAEDFEKHKKGAVIFREGDRGECMYGVREGQVQLSAGGKPLETVEAGGAFGEMALLDMPIRSATAVALTDVKLVPLDQRRFDLVVQPNPFLARAIMGVMARRLRAMNQKD